MARDNPNVDREPAELNNVDPSKLTIRLSQGPGRVAKTFTSSYTAATMRWDNNQDIRNLNRWRSQVFLYVVLLPFHSFPFPPSPNNPLPFTQDRKTSN